MPRAALALLLLIALLLVTRHRPGEERHFLAGADAGICLSTDSEVFK